ncbi:hypothetical protein [Nocardia suismassiliense]|uniref:hypothetical protein n=1 Tax=Nocardia suismassiliense TaxID=2077092 RepID=UPI00131EDCAE|nr:hypothetical protein [Nocardia suismassiliense]
MPYLQGFSQALAEERGYLIVVEGESDCWAGWHHRFPVLGIPGPDQISALALEHISPVRTIFIQTEAANSTTYPAGVTHYTNGLIEHIRTIGYQGDIRLFEHAAGIDDLADLHTRHPHDFSTLLIDTLARSVRR